MVPSRGNARSGRDGFRETFERPALMAILSEPPVHRRKVQRLPGGFSALNHRHEHPAPTRPWALPFWQGLRGTGEEIVHSWRKRRGLVNPLVVGSNPTGPTFPPSADFRRDPT